MGGFQARNDLLIALHKLPVWTSRFDPTTFQPRVKSGLGKPNDRGGSVHRDADG